MGCTLEVLPDGFVENLLGLGERVGEDERSGPGLVGVVEFHLVAGAVGVLQDHHLPVVVAEGVYGPAAHGY
ncbi:MAG: hypothetical protein HY314_08180 [Acidobacteria bacterium]|nr:hypothetical protein [Acidobacteriota bacterium]